MKVLLDRSVVLLQGIILLSTVTSGLLSPQHFSYSFLLNRTEPEPCGINIGGDELNIDPTSAIPGTNSIPISPSFYFFDGSRCKSSTPDHSAFFVISQGFQGGALSLSPELANIAEKIAWRTGEQNIVTFAGARLNDRVRGVSQLAVTHTKRGGRFKRIRGALVTGSVQCGPHNVIGALFMRVEENTEIPYDEGGAFVMRPGMIYAVVGTDERVCLFGGHTRAPNEEISQDDIFHRPEEDPEMLSGNSSSARILGASIGGGIAIGLLVSTIGVYFFLKWRKSHTRDDNVNENLARASDPAQP